MVTGLVALVIYALVIVLLAYVVVLLLGKARDQRNGRADRVCRRGAGRFSADPAALRRGRRLAVRDSALMGRATGHRLAQDSCCAHGAYIGRERARRAVWAP